MYSVEDCGYIPYEQVGCTVRAVNTVGVSNHVSATAIRTLCNGMLCTE